MKPVDYACAACDMMMRRYSPQALPPEGKFYYHQGVFLSGMQKTAELTGHKAYFDYIRSWMDSVLDEEGRPRIAQPGELDDIMAGILLFPLFDQTGDVRYRKAMDVMLSHLLRIPRTSEGAPWHKTKLPFQMWLDGLYMAGPFCSEYAQRFDAPDIREFMRRHVNVMLSHTRDPVTGLYYHAWDESRTEKWCDPETGCSPEFWGRSIGWVTVALLDDLDFLEKDTAAYREILDHARALILTVLKYQSEDGRWYQVINRGDHPDNWLENSCSCLFTAALCKAMRKGYLGREWMDAAARGYEGVIHSVEWDGEDIQIGHVCVGTNVGDLRHYCARPVRVNDLHGAGAFLLMCTEMERLLNA